MVLDHVLNSSLFLCSDKSSVKRRALLHNHRSAAVTAVAAGAVGHRNQLILSSIYCCDFVPECFFGKSNLCELTLRNHQRWMFA